MTIAYKGTRINHTRIKICGVTRVDQSEAIAKAGADAIGIVFYAPSPRAVMDLSLAADIAKAAGPFVSVVGLFVDAREELIAQVLENVSLSCIQFHGNERHSFCEFFNRPYLKAFRMKPGIDVEESINAYPTASGALLDAYVKGVPGGTGEQFNWDLAPGADCQQNIVLAGGLNPDNVAAAIKAVRPYAVDVSGGVERAPGDKDLDKVKAFIENAKAEK